MSVSVTIMMSHPLLAQTETAPSDVPPVAVLVLDLAGNGTHFTDVAGGVFFDLDGTGKPVRTAWTAPNADDGFLVLDMNGNGKVDNGSEILGSGQRAAPGNARLAVVEALVLAQGFPLAATTRPPQEFPGIAWINREDKVYSQLRIWCDANHNGQSEPGELRSLPDLQISAIYLSFLRSRDGKPTVDEYFNAILMEGIFTVTEEGRRGVDYKMPLVQFAR
jgi:hypothetical protein